jgi:hypothetical protein
VPKFYFDTDDGEIIHRDELGTECFNEDAAREQAMLAMTELSRQYLPSFGPGKTLSMTVRCTSGLSLMELTLSYSSRGIERRSPVSL